MRIGTDITKAKTLAPNLIIGDSDRAAETEGLTKLALWALQRILPVVMGDRPDRLVVDTTGAEQLHVDDSASLRATKHLEPQ